MIEWLKAADKALWVLRTTGKILPKALDSFRTPAPARHWIPRLNAYLKGEAEVCRLLSAEPQLVIDGPILLSPAEEQRAEQYRTTLAINDPVAVLSGDLIHGDNPVVIHVRSGDYAAVCALDVRGHRPAMISANALLYCPDSEELVLHRRALGVSRDYPGVLHTFGGAYMPPGIDAREFDHLSLLMTARRETAEESGLGIDIANVPCLLLGRESKIGFLHVALLGMQVSKNALALAIASKEGRHTTIKCADLQHALNTEQWVPAGKAQVLSWLAMGAPNSGRRVRFGRQSAQELFDSIVPG